MKISVQDGGVCDAVGIHRGYEIIARAGFEALDWNIDHALPPAMICTRTWQGNIFEKPLEEVLAHYAEELEVIRRHGLTITQAHASFPAYVPGHPEVLDYMLGIYRRCIGFCAAVGIPRLVVHGISLEQGDRFNTPRTIRELNRKLYTGLIPALEGNTVTVCLENLFTRGEGGKLVPGICTDPNEAVSYIDELNALAGRKAFGLCLDVGHLQLVGGEIGHYCRTLGSRICCLHIHDNDGVSDRHLVPFGGVVDQEALCAALKEIHYRGDLSFETFKIPGQVAKFDPELVQPWLDLVCRIGESFRRRILG